MNKQYKDDPEYQKMFQACLDANKVIARKKVVNYIIYLVVIIILIFVSIYVIWNVLGVKEVFNLYNNIL